MTFDFKGEKHLFEGATKEEILSFEKEHNIKLPEKYKEFLQFSDGGELYLPAGVQFFGVKHTPLIKTGEFIIIGKFAWGDVVLYENEKIQILNHETGEIEETFEDFKVFLDSLPEFLGVAE